MPRSGSTIVASFVNSIDNSLIIGEPHRLARRPRPNVFERTPNIYYTRYGRLDIRPDSNILDQIDSFAAEHNCTMWGFKECWTPWTNPIELLSEYWNRMHKVLVTIRHPRANYASIVDLGNEPWEPKSYNKAYTALIAQCNTSASSEPIILDKFREDPVRTINRALGVGSESAFPLKQFGGGGDTYASTAKKIHKVDTRALYDGDDIDESIEAYDQLLEKYYGTAYSRS
jgi:hypothetical protein